MEGASKSKPMDVAGCECPARTPRRRFISGVVEGFYGTPWSMDQRQRLFKRLGRWNMKSYMYAPKDDAKHRRQWRDMFSPAELESISTLIKDCRQHGVEFIFAISPGLDMVYSRKAELDILKGKLDQVSQLGCSSFAILFDDIELRMCNEDNMHFASFAHAHVYVANAIYEHLNQPETFLFCPTEYCGSRALPSVSESQYLNTIGQHLNIDIGVLWTGPMVIPRSISVESIQEVGKVLRRRPVIWDNLHANDYDRQRLFLGPYQGRPLTLRRYICGVLTNPNCECEVNFIPMHTLSTWCSTPVPPAEPYPEVQSSGSSSDLSGSCSSSTSVLSEIRTSDDEFYLAHEALQLALTEWSDEVIQLRSEKIEGKGSNVDSAAVLADAHQAVDNVDDVFGFAPLPYSPPITPEQISLLVDVFHLPHSHGLVSTHLLKQLSWLWKSAGWCCVYPTAVLPNSLSTDQVAGTCEDDAMMTGGASSQSLMSQNSSIPVVPLSSCPLESHPSGDLAAGGSDADMQSVQSKDLSSSSSATALRDYNEYWRQQAAIFHSTCLSIQAMTTSVLSIPNVPLLQNLTFCVNALQAAICKVDFFVSRLESLTNEEQSRLLDYWSSPMSGACQPQWSSDQQESQWNDANEPWSVCGGLAGDLLRQLPDLSALIDVPSCVKTSDELDSGISDAPPSPLQCDFLAASTEASTLQTESLDFLQFRNEMVLN